MNNLITQAYSGSQAGGDLPYFIGKQYGSGWLRTLARFAFPILKKAVGVATNTAEDVIMEKKPFIKSLRDNAMDEISNTLGQGNLPINRRKRKRSATSSSFEHNTIYARKKPRRK